MDKKLMWFLAFLLGTLVTSTAVGYLWAGKIMPSFVLGMALGGTIGWIVISRVGSRRGMAEPLLDERHRQHNLWAGYWSFLFLNLLLIAALLQPWAPHSQTGLWVGILIAGTGFYLGSLLILERKR